MKNILIVDDSALMRRVLSDIIDDNKELNAAYLAEDGVEALEILDSGAKVDAIVLDINMPRMDGIAFLKVLNERHQREKVLIVSTLAQKGGAELFVRWSSVLLTLLQSQQVFPKRRVLSLSICS